MPVEKSTKKSSNRRKGASFNFLFIILKRVNDYLIYLLSSSLWQCIQFPSKWLFHLYYKPVVSTWMASLYALPNIID
jgi:hypothetical protein